MIRISMNLFLIALLALILSSCASTPTWSGISTTEISQWKAMSIDPGGAQRYRGAGLNPNSVANWTKHGFSRSAQIMAWHKEAFDATDAQHWKGEGFSVENAVKWRDKVFTSREAGEWKKGGFNLKSATKNRDKGLTPIK